MKPVLVKIPFQLAMDMAGGDYGEKTQAAIREQAIYNNLEPGDRSRTSSANSGRNMLADHR